MQVAVTVCWMKPAPLHFLALQVFLLSTTAGGAGLNLTGANRLVLLDRWGAPQSELPRVPAVPATPVCGLHSCWPAP